MELIFFCIAYLLFKGDLASPSVISIFVFLIATLFTIYNIDEWEIIFYKNTVIVISIGLLVMIIAEFLTIKCNKRKNFINEKEILNKNSIPYINIGKRKIIIIVFLNIMFTILYYLQVKKTGSALGFNGLSSIAGVKNNYMSGNNEIKMNVIVRQSFKFVMASAYIHSFLIINNCISSESKVKKNAIHFIPIICGVIITIFSGSRTEIMRIFSACMIDYFILWRENKNWKKVSSKKFLKIAIPVIVLIGIIFSSVKSLVKLDSVRTNNISSTAEYVGYYIGSPIQVLNIKIQDGANGGDLLNLNKNNISEFVYLNKSSGIGGNAATIFASMQINYGIIGMIIYIFLLYFILGYIYHNKLEKSRSSYKRNRLLILFSFFYFLFTMSYYSDCLYLVISISGLLTLLCIAALYLFYFKVKI